MKFFLFKIFLILSLQLFSLSLFAQTSFLNRKVTASFRQITLAEAFLQLQKQYSLAFSYSNDKVSLDKIVNAEFKEATLEEVLAELLSGTGIVFEIIDDQIILKSKRIVQTVRGTVRDKLSKTPLNGANVQILGEGIQSGTITNARGQFSFSKIPVGRKDIGISYLGYEPLIIEKFVVTSGKEVVLEVELTELAVSLEEIVVSGNSPIKHHPVNSMALASARSFTPEETSRYPASFLDPSRMAQSYAGVSLYDDLNNDIVIRGNSSKGLLWRIEGIEVHNPNHFFDEGATGGAISMLSNNVLDNSDFYTSAFPAEYGNALSGVFDLRFRKGNNEKREYALSTGVLGTQVGLEGPFSNNSKASYLVNYRYSTIGILGLMGINLDNVQAARFQDLSFNINLPFKKSSLSIFGLGGSSWGGERAQKDTTLAKYLYYKINNDSRYLSGMAGIKYNHNFSNNLYLENILSLSGYKTTSNSDTLNQYKQPQLVDSDTFSNETVRLSTALNFKAGAKSLFKAGGILSISNFKYYSYQQNVAGEVYNYLYGKGDAQLLQAYVQWKYNVSQSLILNTGVHVAHFNLSNNTSIEPRLSLKYKLNEQQQFSAGWGIHSRIEPLITYYNLKTANRQTVNAPNTNLKMTKAQHFVLGYHHSFSRNLRLNIETYYQDIYNVPVLDDSTRAVSAMNSVDGYTVYFPPVDTLVNKGTGRNYGIEFTLEKFFSRKFYFLATSSLYESKFKVPHFKEFNSSFNSNIAATITGGKEFLLGKESNNVLGINGKFVFSGGRRYTPIDLEKSIETRETCFIYEKSNTLKTSNYYRLDMSVYYKINLKKTTHSFYVDIQNVTDRRNTRTYLFDKNTNSIYKVYFNGILPNIYYKIQF